MALLKLFYTAIEYNMKYLFFSVHMPGFSIIAYSSVDQTGAC